MAGMLTGLFTPKYNDMQQDARDEEARLQRVATMDPFQQAGYAMLQGGHMAGRGLGEAAVTLAGGDPRSPAKRNLEAVEAAKAEVSKLGFNPEDPKSIDEFYKRVIMILQQKGLAAEALEVAREWHKQKVDDQKTTNAQAEIDRKRVRDAQTDARAQERNRILEKKGALQAETVQLLSMYDSIDPLAPNAKFQQDAIVARLNALAAAGKKGVKFVNLNDRVQIVDALTGEEIRTENTGEKPMTAQQRGKGETAEAKLENAYESAKLKLQQDYDAAVELYMHPGLKEATGTLAGLAVKGDPNNPGFWNTVNRARMSAAGQSAVAKMQQVMGGVFIASVNDLKAASEAMGSKGTGLGQLTEVEGAKIQNAKAALDPQQQYPSYRSNLAQYIRQLEASGALLDSGAQRIGVKTARPLKTKPLQGAVATPAAQPTHPPAAAPSVAPAASGDRVRVKMPDGQVGTIPRANLEAAKAQGAVEVQ